jgi:hypothetical protein
MGHLETNRTWLEENKFITPIWFLVHHDDLIINLPISVIHINTIFNSFYILYGILSYLYFFMLLNIVIRYLMYYNKPHQHQDQEETLLMA